VREERGREREVKGRIERLLREIDQEEARNMQITKSVQE